MINDKGNGNIYLFSVARDGSSSIIASNRKESVEGKDIVIACNISPGECDFLLDNLYDNISLPLVLIGERDCERRLIFIARHMLFETSVCIAFEMCIESIPLFCDSDRFMLSPKAQVLFCRDISVEQLNSMSFARDALALASESSGTLMDAASNFDGIVLLIKHLVEIDICIETVDSGVVGIYDTGRVFLGGFCLVSVLYMAIATKKYSADGKMYMSAYCNSGHIVLNISYTNAKRRIWQEAEVLKDIADAYGVALDITVSEGKTICRLIPERVDDGLVGVKEELMSLFELF